MADPAALLSIEGAIATITLNRPERLNAFNADLHRALGDAFDRVEADRAIRALILTGAGRAFCAGQDLAERASGFEAGNPPELARSLEQNYNPLVRRIAALAVPVIAAVNGLAFGAGAALAIGCDLVLAAASARFQFAFVKVALGPDCGTSWLLPRLVGQVRALDLALTGRSIDAVEAERIGLVSRVTPDEALMAEATTLAKELAAASPRAIAAIKRQLRAAATLSLDAALDTERDAQGMLGDENEYRTAVLNFAARR